MRSTVHFSAFLDYFSTAIFRVVENDFIDAMRVLRDEHSVKELYMSRTSRRCVLQRLGTFHFLPRLECDDINGRALLETLRCNPTLRELAISGCEIGSALGAELLPQALAPDCNLSVLILLGNTFVSEAVLAIVGALHNNTILRTLSLMCGSVRDSSVTQQLASVLSHNKHLRSLDLRENYIGALGLGAIVRALETNFALTYLCLSDNEVDSQTVQILADNMCTNQTLRELVLRHNQIDDNGAVAIAAMLVRNTALERLDLSANLISDTGVVSIARALENNRTLLELRLDCISLTAESSLAIERALRSNWSLKILILDDEAPDLEKIFDQIFDHINRNAQLTKFCDKRILLERTVEVALAMRLQSFPIYVQLEIAEWEIALCMADIDSERCNDVRNISMEQHLQRLRNLGRIKRIKLIDAVNKI